MAVMTRRSVLKMTLAGLLIPVVNIRDASAEEARLPLVDDSNPTAIALKYKKTQAEAQGVPGYAEGHRCDNCMHFVKETSGCNLFPGNAVAAEGWCTAWVAQPAQ